MRLVLVGIGLLLGLAPVAAAPPVGIEQGIGQQLNAYRRGLGLPPVPRSALLDQVARAHVGDLWQHHPDSGTDGQGRACNPHSWSASGPWEAVCYTGVAAVAPGMWSKPRQVTHGRYAGDGFEIALVATGPLTATRAVESWKRSPDHIDMVAERGQWNGAHWKAMGIATGHGYAVVWFGRLRDLSR